MTPNNLIHERSANVADYVQPGMAIALIVLCVVIGVFDTWAMFRLDGSYTVSAIIQTWSSQYPVLPLLVGLLLGHLFFPRNPLR